MISNVRVSFELQHLTLNYQRYQITSRNLAMPDSILTTQCVFNTTSLFNLENVHGKLWKLKLLKKDIPAWWCTIKNCKTFSPSSSWVYIQTNNIHAWLDMSTHWDIQKPSLSNIYIMKYKNITFDKKHEIKLLCKHWTIYFMGNWSLL